VVPLRLDSGPQRIFSNLIWLQEIEESKCLEQY